MAAAEASETKLEFVDGQIRMMSGGTPDHALISANIVIALSAALKGKDCKVYSSDLRVRVGKRDYVHPDVTVVCGARVVDEVDTNAVTNPVLVVEVLSKTTEPYDRGPKLLKYSSVPSLRVYVMVRQDAPFVEVVSRDDAEGGWNWIQSDDLTQTLPMEGLGINLEMAPIYAGVEFDG